MTYRIVSIHGMDPRGAKVGGMETHVRQLLRHHPVDLPLLMIGVDDTGELELGKVHRIDVNGRQIDFVPVVHVPPAEQIGGAKVLTGSLTFRFAKALMSNLFRLRKIIGGSGASAEVERFEYASVARALGCKLVVIVHNEGDPKKDKMDSLLKRYWWVQEVSEYTSFRMADRIFCVTPKLRERLGQRHPSQLKKAEVLTVSVDTQLFHPTPFDLVDGKLRIVYAGRLDEFKDPPVMFRVCKALHDALGGAFEFHYCGSEDPNKFAEFALDFRVYGPPRCIASCGRCRSDAKGAHGNSCIPLGRNAVFPTGDPFQRPALRRLAPAAIRSSGRTGRERPHDRARDERRRDRGARNANDPGPMGRNTRRQSRPGGCPRQDRTFLGRAPTDAALQCASRIIGRKKRRTC
jgi:glycosyltransferase involved in cell wall biosynthesis